MPPRISQSTARKLRLRCALFPPAHTTYSSKVCIHHNATVQSSAVASRPSLNRKQTLVQSHLTRAHSSDTSSSNIPNNRAELKAALLNLQKVAGSYVTISPLQLALRGLDQKPGQETIRIAIYGLGSSQLVAEKTREIVRLLIADPLSEEQEWERSLLEGGLKDQPVLLKIGPNEEDLHVSSNRLVKEIHVSSPLLNSYQLEILVLQSDTLEAGLGTSEGFAESVLVPTVEIPTSNTGRYTPVTTPVHKAIVVGDGLLGAASLANLSSASDVNNAMAVVNLPGYLNHCQEELPFHVIDVSLAKSSLAVFRQSVNNAVEYEHEWFASGFPVLLNFLKAGTSSSSSTSLKRPVSSLVSNIIEDTRTKIRESEKLYTISTTSSQTPTSTLESLNTDLHNWSQRAHTELRDTLEAAFYGRRWKKLNWWKLFWRVDDVSMISNDILQQRFLPEAEKEIIFLAGKIEATVVQDKVAASTRADSHGANWAYKTPQAKERIIAIGNVAPDAQYSDLIPKSVPEESLPSLKLQPWPLNIPITRIHMTQTTVPALQALAQKLLLQTLSTSGIASALSALIYVSDSTTGFYEAGAVASLGIVWSLRSLQQRWERARDFWEEEVREEGRKAIRSVEADVENFLKEPNVQAGVEKKEFLDAKSAVDRVEKALAAVDSEFLAAKGL